MKKIMIFIFTLIYLFSVKNVFAQDQYQLTLEKQNGIYMSRRGVNYGYDSYPYYIYKIDGMFAYCVEPGKHISTYVYEGVSDYVDLGFSDELKGKLELIGYYGREYPGHNNVLYSMATQALIWELTGVDKVTFWTKLNEEGEEIDISKERNEIMDLVNRHKLFPNISENITADLNKEIIIHDDNNLLSNYEIGESDKNEFEIIDNNLHIIPRTIGEDSITLKYKKYDNLNTIILVGKGSDSQKMGRLRLSTDKKIDIRLKVNGVKLVINKIDSDGNKVNIEGIKFKIKNVKDNTYLCENEVCEYTTNSEGIFITKDLDYGEYEIEEIKNQELPEYIINTSKVKVIIDENSKIRKENDNNYMDINFVNEKVKGSIEILKKGEESIFENNEIIYEKNHLDNIEFNLFNDQDELIDVIKTNEDGYAIYDNLEVGKYYVEEKTKLDNYVLNNEKKYFEIKKENNKGNSVRLDIDNYLIKGRLEFSKEDLVTSEGIPNTIIEIYSEDNTLLLTRETDSDGKIVIDNLPIGKYYIIEKEANTMYQITNEKVYFEIKENGSIVKAKMTNEKKVIEVPKTNTKEELITHSLFLLSLLFGLGRFYYERKKAT